MSSYKGLMALARTAQTLGSQKAKAPKPFRAPHRGARSISDELAALVKRDLKTRTANEVARLHNISPSVAVNIRDELGYADVKAAE